MNATPLAPSLHDRLWTSFSPKDKAKKQDTKQKDQKKSDARSKANITAPTKKA